MVILLLMALLLLIYQYHRTQIDADWETFKQEHECKIIKNRDGNSRHTGWICNDGKEYYRWRQMR